MKIVRNILKRLSPPCPTGFLVVITLVGTLLFTLIRIALYLENRELLTCGIDNNSYWVMRAMGVGFRFDLNFTFTLMLPAAIALAIGQFMGRHARHAARIGVAWLAVSYATTLMAAIGNVPYFSHFQAHINAMSMKYATKGLGDTLAMIMSDTSYLIHFIAAILVAVAFVLFIVWFARKLDIYTPTSSRWHTVACIAALSLLYIWADRGFYLRHRTLEPRDSKISNNAFINKLGLNPIEPFIVSLDTASDTIQLMDSDEARDIVREEMQRDNTFNEHVEAKESPWRNVVFIIEESCTAARLTREGSNETLMPNLDRLVNEGIYFENLYSAGTHTCNAVYALVTSLPGFVDKHPMQDGLERPLNTIFSQVYSRGELKTLFYVTHGPNYDNLRSFLTTQGFERLLSRNNYGVETDKMWGVDDHIMFDYALADIDREWANGNAVATVLLTCSNHSPYNPPLDVGFTPTTNDPESQAVEYADWAMNRFLEMARERAWFDKTLFVIMGDHGRTITTDYEIPESINHVPLLFYSPKHITPEVRSDLVTQMDIAPTAFSMLGMEYDNHTMGIDLNNDSRRMIPFGHDGHIAARDHEWLYIYDVHSDAPYLYNLNAEGDLRLENVATEHPERVKDMHTYTSAMMQAGWDIHNMPNSMTLSK
jgi:phosphoglycerol transferase MdoB-like AlkP superfamily enzyme